MSCAVREPARISHTSLSSLPVLRDGQFKKLISVLGNGFHRVATQDFPKAHDQIREVSLTHVYIGPEYLSQFLFLKRGTASILLEPKAFDALLCLVRAAEHLVSKQEL